ncbi:MAG: BrnT family toxin [Methylobacterium sp.]|nr:BrnT family toxin [Methylobacterium sp.]MCA3638690.1 BrnT family toxin [Methylobacterium sp.]
MKMDWDEAKRLANIEKHGIDFDDVDVLFLDERSVIYPSPRNDEERFVLVGLLNFRFVSVVFTKRGETIRIISARISRKEEQALWLRNASKPS